jgi:hypothetical protein
MGRAVFVMNRHRRSTALVELSDGLRFACWLCCRWVPLDDQLGLCLGPHPLDPRPEWIEEDLKWAHMAASDILMLMERA